MEYSSISWKENLQCDKKLFNKEKLKNTFHFFCGSIDKKK